ncbi:MAG: ThuA domain-containing protein [Acidobacteriota bacterium]
MRRMPSPLRGSLCLIAGLSVTSLIPLILAAAQDATLLLPVAKWDAAGCCDKSGLRLLRGAEPCGNDCDASTFGVSTPDCANQYLAMVRTDFSSRIPAESASDRSLGSKTLRLLIVTGGHDFEAIDFFRMFDEMPGVRWTHAAFGTDAEDKLTLQNSDSYDVALFYDMHQQHEPHYRDWLSVLERGKPTVFLHHALGSYVKWDGYGEIVGGRANFGREVVEWAPNTKFQHDVAFRVHIADKNHPITKGLDDFEILDETYRHFAVNAAAHVLLTTDHPSSGKIIGWTHQYKKSPVVYLQLGHGPSAYNNPNFRTLLTRSIQWVSAAGHSRR